MPTFVHSDVDERQEHYRATAAGENYCVIKKKIRPRTDRQTERIALFVHCKSGCGRSQHLYYY